jgi:predicted DNA binding protein
MKNITILNKSYKLQEDTIYATQKEVAEIFGVANNTISEHIKNIFITQELEEKETCRIFRNVSNQPVKHYSLDMIIAVGYRVNSLKATKFRIEATKILKEYLMKGSVERKFSHPHPNIPLLSNIKPFKLKFNDDVIFLAKIPETGNVLFNLNSICENIRINAKGQRERIKKDEILSKEIYKVRAKFNQMSFFIPLEYLDEFLEGIYLMNNRINYSTSKKKLTLYRKECFHYIKNSLNLDVSFNKMNLIKDFKEEKREVKAKKEKLYCGKSENNDNNQYLAKQIMKQEMSKKLSQIHLTSDTFELLKKYIKDDEDLIQQIMITYSDNNYIMANIYVLEKLGKDKITKSLIQASIKEDYAGYNFSKMCGYIGNGSNKIN